MRVTAWLIQTGILASEKGWVSSELARRHPFLLTWSESIGPHIAWNATLTMTDAILSKHQIEKLQHTESKMLFHWNNESKNCKRVTGRNSNWKVGLIWMSTRDSFAVFRFGVSMEQHFRFGVSKFFDPVFPSWWNSICQSKSCIPRNVRTNRLRSCQ